MNSRRFSRSSTNGFSLIELLIFIVVSIAIVSGALSLILSMRGALEHDIAQVDLNQNLRTAVTVIGNDIRQVGERLPKTGGMVFPALLLSQDTDTSILTLRRNLSSEVITLCESVKPGDGTLSVAYLEEPSRRKPDYCLADSPAEERTFKDQIRAWADIYESNQERGKDTYMFFYNPADRQGDFVKMGNVDVERLKISMDTSTLTRRYDFDWRTPLLGQLRVYLLEEREYTFEDDKIMLRENRTDPQTLAYAESFYVSADLDGEIREALTTSDDWTDVYHLDVEMSGTLSNGSTRTLNTQLFPRNTINLEIR